MCFSVYTTYIVSEERRREGRDLGWEEERRKRSGMGRGEKEEIWNVKRRDLGWQEERTKREGREKEERRKREGAAVRWNVCI